MASMIDDLKQSITGRLEFAGATSAAGCDAEEELATATGDIEALCNETDRLYRNTVTSMW